jgi:RimJ/RimL family protein N-acetyltransferase
MWIGMARDSTEIGKDAPMRRLIEPAHERVLEFCAHDSVERVFIEDVARRGLGRFVALEAGDGSLDALCHIGANLVPSGTGCAAFADAAARSGSRMLIGEEQAVSELWQAAAKRLPKPREDRPGQPVYTIVQPPPAGGTGLRPATLDDLELLLPACAAAHTEELGVDPLGRDEEGFRWRTRAQIEDGRSWVWTEDGAIRFKAEASAWTPEAVQIQQVWVDPGLRRRGYGSRGLRDLVRLLLESTPVVTLFVRTDNTSAISLYESIGMTRALTYRSLLF